MNTESARSDICPKITKQRGGFETNKCYTVERLCRMSVSSVQILKLDVVRCVLRVKEAVERCPSPLSKMPAEQDVFKL